MLLLDHLVAYDDDCGEATGTVRPGHLFARADGSLHPVAAVEMLAQSAAAHEGYRRLHGGDRVGGGFLATIRDVTLAAGPRCGQTVRAGARRTMAVGDLQVVSGEVTAGGRAVAGGELLFYLSDELAPAALGVAAMDEVAPAAGGIAAAVERALEAWDPTSATAEFLVAADFPAFAGHFPGFPLLPAVVTVLLAERAVTAAVGRPWAVTRIQRAKFSGPIRPGCRVRVVCRPDGERGVWRLQVDGDAGPVARLSLEDRDATAEGE